MTGLVVAMYLFIGLIVVVGGIGAVGALISMAQQQAHESHH